MMFAGLCRRSAALGLVGLGFAGPIASSVFAASPPPPPTMEPILQGTPAHDYPLLAALPFALLLFAIAFLPFAFPKFWHREHNRSLVVAILALPALIVLLAVSPVSILDTAREYGSFIVLLGALFTVSGGIVLDGDLEATPRVNAAFLGLGALLANLVGTTGASMLLLRPLLRTNSERRNVSHIPIFFILIVSNCGGMLTPLGDPPLFLGYLRGVPFLWTLRLLPIWAIFNGWLLFVFLIQDTRAWRRERPDAIRRDRAEIEPLRLRGLPNLALLAVVVAAVTLPSPWREILMVGAAVVSYLTTPAILYTDNRFDFGPIREVAILFAGIFVTMVPALELVHRHAAELGLRASWQFFWTTGALSSILDNAPTYLTFLSAARGLPHTAPLIEGAGVPHALLAAISAGAVAMGANTYIGNGPNFMVKAIAEGRGIPMPSFAGYAVRAVAIMMPAYLLVTIIFFL